MTDLNHFDSCISITQRQAIKDFAELVESDYIGDLGESLGCTHLNEISGVPISGFYPYQQGGYEVSEFIRCDTDASYHLNDSMTESVNKSYDYMCECLMDEHSIDLQEYDKLTESQQETVHEYENDWFDPALLRFEVWVKDSVIHMHLSANYSDAPYYRDRSDDRLKEKELTLAEFSKIDKDELLKEFFTL